MSEEAFELDLMKECEIQLGFELYDATSEIIGGENSTFGRQTTGEVILSKNLRSALLKLNPNLPQEAIDNDKDLFQEKCNSLYDHFYDYYNSADDNIYTNVA